MRDGSIYEASCAAALAPSVSAVAPTNEAQPSLSVIVQYMKFFTSSSLRIPVASLRAA